ncbi:hypothetical protein G9A89_020580 [Geosiphon pyriformis]|nr:hypothetical protein G9A89_020580 [Geosiphon pyriformis]
MEFRWLSKTMLNSLRGFFRLKYAFAPKNLHHPSTVVQVGNFAKSKEFFSFEYANSTKSDFVGTPDLVSNLRPIKYYIAEKESNEDRDWRLHRERVDRFNQQFWSSNNQLFILEKQEFENQIIKKTGEKPTPSEMSLFYKEFLDKAYERQMAYNKRWWKENFVMLLPAAKATFKHFKKSYQSLISHKSEQES